MPGNIVTGWLGDTVHFPNQLRAAMKTQQGSLSLKANIKTTFIIFSWKWKKTVTLAEFVSPSQSFRIKLNQGSTSPPSPSGDKAHSLVNHWRCFEMDFSCRDFRSPTADAEANRVKHGPLSPGGKESSVLQGAALNHYWRSVAELSSGLLPAKRLPLECFRSCKFV